MCAIFLCSFHTRFLGRIFLVCTVILMLPGICLVYFSKPFFISPSAPITTGIVVAFIPHIHSISISRSLYFDTFSVTLTEVFFSIGMDISMSRQLFSCLSFIVGFKMYSLSIEPKPLPPLSRGRYHSDVEHRGACLRSLL